MRNAALAIVLAVAGGLGSAAVNSTASAQTLESEYAGPNLRYGPKGYYFDDSAKYRGRGYGFTRYYEEPAVVVDGGARYRGRTYGYTGYYERPVVVVPQIVVPQYIDPRFDQRYVGGCGEYRYWNGAYCADARDR